jgi:sugar phosphate isomerase/epimerase
MLRLGFVTAILPDLSFEEVVEFAGAEKFACIEVMCWPKGQADRRYAGVTHIDVAGFDRPAADQAKATLEKHGVSISGLGYYPNPLAPDDKEAAVCVDHLKQVIQAAELLDVPVVNTFIGRDWTKSIDDNWPRFLATWRPLITFAEDHGIKIGIENCPMSFTKDEWPGGKNLAISPAVWRRMFNDIPSANFGLNFDPSHFVWQQIDYVKAMREFKMHLFHMHAKDARLDLDGLNEHGSLAFPTLFHTPKLTGTGDVNWGRFFSTLSEIYSGPVCIEVEDRAYEGSLEARKESLRISRNYLRQFIAS